MSDELATSAPARRRPKASSAAPDFRAVFDASPNPLLLVVADPPQFTMLAVNAAHARAFATTPQALVGRGVLEVFNFAIDLPGVAEFVDAIRTSFEAVLARAAPDQMAVRPYAVPAADGTSEERYWSAVNSPILGPDGAVTHIVSAARDVTGVVLERRGDEARALLMREVDHRARNALTVVQSFVRLTTADTIEDYRRVVDGRVEALARAQTSLAARRWEGADLREVVEGELSALAEPARYALDGDPVMLPAGHVQAMSMAIHELATNAAKYGALATHAGRLAISWRRRGAHGLLLSWEERGGREVREPGRVGFGSRLIARLARQMGGEARYDWRRDGLVVELDIGLE